MFLGVSELLGQQGTTPHCPLLGFHLNMGLRAVEMERQHKGRDEGTGSSEPEVLPGQELRARPQCRDLRYCFPGPQLFPLQSGDCGPLFCPLFLPHIP